MPSKTEEYLALAQRTANGLTRYWESWTDYLTTASRLYSSMNYGWATVFTLAAWFAGLVIDVNVRVGDLGLRTVLPVIVMGCCVMKYIKDNSK